MHRALIILAVVILLTVAWAVVFTGTPLFGRSIALKQTPVASIELSMSSRREITASNLCAQVLQTLHKASIPLSHHNGDIAGFHPGWRRHH